MTVTVVLVLCLLGLAPVLASLGGLFSDPQVLFETLFSARIASLWGATMALGLATAAASMLIGVPVAWVLARRGGRVAMAVATLLPLPLVLPPWVSGVAWTQVLPLKGFGGAVFLLTLSLWPLVALFALRGLAASGAAVEAARLARGPRAALRSVELPLALPSILSGALLVFVFAITDFGVVDFLSFYDPEPFTVLASEIFQEWSRLQRGPQAAAVSLPTIVPALVALLVVLRLERSFTGRWRGAARRVPRAASSGAGAGLSVAGLAVVMALMLAPVAVLVGWVWGYDGAVDLLRDKDVHDSVMRSVGVGLGTGLVLAWLGVAAARVSLAASPRVERLILLLAILPLAAPSVMLAMGEVILWNHPANPLSDAVYLSPTLLVIAMAGRFCALGILVARALLLRLDPGPGEAARLVPRPRWQRWLVVDLPRLMPAVGISLTLGYLLSMRELELVMMTPAGNGTLTHRIFSMVHIGTDEMTSTLCLTLVALVVVPAVAARLLGVRGVDCPGPDSGP